MAHKTMRLTEAGVQNYRTRMLVGDPIVLSGSDARRLAKIGWVEEPQRRLRPAPPAVVDEPEAEVVWKPSPAIEAAVAPKKAAPRKKAAKKRNA